MASFINPNRHPRTADQIVAAMAEFDAKDRDGYNFAQNSFVVLHDGQMYPPKAIIALATGMAVREFSGGEPANRYLRERGFVVVDLREKGRGAVQLAQAFGMPDEQIEAA